MLVPGKVVALSMIICGNAAPCAAIHWYVTWDIVNVNAKKKKYSTIQATEFQKYTYKQKNK